MGDTRRFASSDDAVRHSGLDITVYASDSKRARGHLARQGPATLRWALYEAAVCATRPNSPDHAYFLAVKRRADGHLGVISVARKLARRVHHTLRALGDQAWEPVWRSDGGAACAFRSRADDLRPAPPVCLPASGTLQRLLDSLTRLMRPHPVGTTRSTITSPEATASEHQGKAGRSHAGALVIAGMPEREVAAM